MLPNFCFNSCNCSGFIIFVLVYSVPLSNILPKYFHFSIQTTILIKKFNQPTLRVLKTRRVSLRLLLVLNLYLEFSQQKHLQIIVEITRKKNHKSRHNCFLLFSIIPAINDGDIERFFWAFRYTKIYAKL